MTALGRLRRKDWERREGSSRHDVSECNYSIFVAPFRYRIEDCDNGEDTAAELVYRPHDFGGWSARSRDTYRAEYFGSETQSILFGRGNGTGITCETLWLDLHIGSSDLESRLQVEWPGVGRLPLDVRLVLFHYQHAGVGGRTAAACIGMLIVEAKMSADVDMEQLLKFNERFRRLRWPYLDAWVVGDETTEALPAVLPGARLLLDEQSKELPSAPDSLGITLWPYLAAHPLDLKEGRKKLVDIDFSVHPDNRAFVACHATVSGIAWSLDSSARLWRLWHQLLYVDPGEAPLTRPYLTTAEDNWVRSRTYSRWAESEYDARLFGYSSYSFCCLCTEAAWDLPAAHFREMYLDQTLLVLYQRTAIFSFGRELAKLTQRWKSEGWRVVRGDFVEFREAFAQFVNLYWYPVLTHQVQGIELYEVARRELDNSELFEELRREFETTSEHLEGSAAEEASGADRRLSIIVVILTLVAVPLALLGTNLVAWRSAQLTFLTYQGRSAWLAVVGVWVVVIALIFAVLKAWPWVTARVAAMRRRSRTPASRPAMRGRRRS